MKIKKVMTGEQFEITENELAIIQQLRQMSPREKLIITKQSANNSQEYVAIRQSLMFFTRGVDNDV